MENQPLVRPLLEVVRFVSLDLPNHINIRTHNGLSRAPVPCMRPSERYRTVEKPLW